MTILFMVLREELAWPLCRYKGEDIKQEQFNFNSYKVVAKQLPNAVVLGNVGTEEGLDAITANGAKHALNHRQDGYLDHVLELTEGQGVDIILEMLANVNLGLGSQLLCNLPISKKIAKLS